MHSKRVRGGLIVLAVLLIAGLSVFYYYASSQPATSKLTLSSGTSLATDYELETVTSSADQTKGLSGRSGLAANTGMLFSYDNVERRCIWMKDMKFNIDILWLDDSNRLSSIVRDLSPSTYPQSYCADAKNIIELQAGEADKHNLRVGQVIKL